MYYYLQFACQDVKVNVEFIDPLGLPTVTAGSDHCFRTCCPSARPSKSRKKHKQSENNVATSETMGLAGWIIDDTCLVYLYFLKKKVFCLQ